MSPEVVRPAMLNSEVEKVVLQLREGKQGWGLQYGDIVDCRKTVMIEVKGILEREKVALVRVLRPTVVDDIDLRGRPAGSKV